MIAGICIVSQCGLGTTLLNSARYVLTEFPVPVLSYELIDENHDKLKQSIQKDLNKLNAHQGILFFTDLYGSSASRIAENLTSQYPESCLISGVNLPMVLKALNYCHKPINTLSSLVLESAQRGIFIVPTSTKQRA